MHKHILQSCVQAQSKIPIIAAVHTDSCMDGT